MKKSVYWLLAVVITLVLSIYQRMTGPTYPQKVTVELNGESYKVKLPRSGVQQDEIVKLKGIPQTQGNISLHYRQYPTTSDYTTVDFVWKDSVWQAALPVQPVAGKLQYYLTVGDKDYQADEPVVIRFRNDVPAYILIPHILLMFGAMLFAVLRSLHALVGDHAQALHEVALDHGGYVVCRRFYPRPSRATCGIWSLVGWIPLRHGPDRQ